MEPTDASIGHQLKKDGRSPHGDFGTCLIQDAAITLFWAVGRRCAADAGDDSECARVSMQRADVGTLVPFHIDDEVHRFIACGPSRSEEVKTSTVIHTSNSQPNVIEPNTSIRPTLSTAGASTPKMDWESTGSWPPGCASPSKYSSFPTEGRDLESICQATVRGIDEYLEEASEIVKSIQFSRNVRRESTMQGQYFNKPFSTDSNGCDAWKIQVIHPKWSRR